MRLRFNLRLVLLVGAAGVVLVLGIVSSLGPGPDDAPASVPDLGEEAVAATAGYPVIYGYQRHLAVSRMGQNVLVVLNGRNFGSAPGTVSALVRFGERRQRNAAKVLTWSDEAVELAVPADGLRQDNFSLELRLVTAGQREVVWRHRASDGSQFLAASRRALGIRERAPPPTRPRKATIVLDPGHGAARKGNDPLEDNPRSVSGAFEEQVTFELANLVAANLEQVSESLPQIEIKVQLTVGPGSNRALSTRAFMCYQVSCDRFVSLHFTTSEHAMRGVATFYATDQRGGNFNLEDDRAFAERLHRHVVSALRQREPRTGDRGAREKQLAVLSDEQLGNSTFVTRVRATLLEIDNFDAPDVDRMLISGPDAGNAMAELAAAITLAILEDLVAPPADDFESEIDDWPGAGPDDWPDSEPDSGSGFS